mmetsp:Transcript_18545/g.33497  ORF Transcript_18545/g.33497 Transcript_18545/m.33497 type:complete len:162 (-) Transcript_18545:337-822(-)
MKCYRLIMRAQPSQPVFMENLASAYMLLDSRRGGLNTGMSGAEYCRLLRMVCVELPEEWLSKVVSSLGKDDVDSVTFEEFSAGISAAFMHKECCADALGVFKALDPLGVGRVEKMELLVTMEKLTQQADLKLPSRGDLAASLPTEVTCEVFLSAVSKSLLD